MTEVVVTSDNWSCGTWNAPVKSSPPTNQHPVCLQAGCPSRRPTNSVRALKGKSLITSDDRIIFFPLPQPGSRRRTVPFRVGCALCNTWCRWNQVVRDDGTGGGRFFVLTAGFSGDHYVGPGQTVDWLTDWLLFNGTLTQTGYIVRVPPKIFQIKLSRLASAWLFYGANSLLVTEPTAKKQKASCDVQNKLSL